MSTPNGLFALFSLDGSPLDPLDRGILFAGLDEAPLAVPGGLVAARDAATARVHVHRTPEGIAILLGDIDDATALGQRLGMPHERNAAALAAAAHARWGRATPREVAGEWLLLCWHAAARTATLVMAAGAHERCHVATDGRRLAIAPDLVRLARLPWVDARFDTDILMRTMGRAHVRASIGARTFLKQVTRVEAAATLSIDARGLRIEAPDPLVPPPLAAIGFDDAIGEIDTLLRGIVRQRLARVGDIAVQMSGGLDSSLMGLLAAQERRAGQRLVFLTSAAPPGSGIEDETDWARRVAAHLGVEMIPVVPGADADIYAPDARTFAASEAPTLSPRHYLYAALAAAAVDAGASVMVDGSFGELTISNHGGALASMQRVTPRALARSLRDRWETARTPMQRGEYHVMPAPGIVAQLGHLRALRPKSYASRRIADGSAFGYEDGFATIGELPTATSEPTLRTLLPLRDPRLIELMARFPVAFVRHGGIDRAPIRALLRGGLPDAVVTRPKGLAFSPTYDAMLQAQASAAIDRLSDQRAAGAGDYLDLDWLSMTLHRLRRGERLPSESRIRTQGTAYAAAFFTWWHRSLAEPMADTKAPPSTLHP